MSDLCINFLINAQNFKLIEVSLLEYTTKTNFQKHKKLKTQFQRVVNIHK